MSEKDLEAQFEALSTPALYDKSARLDELLKRAEQLVEDMQEHGITTIDELKKNAELADALIFERKELNNILRVAHEDSARLVKVVRQRTNLTAAEIAQRVGVSSYTVVRWEKGELGMRASARKILLSLLGL